MDLCNADNLLRLCDIEFNSNKKFKCEVIFN